MSHCKPSLGETELRFHHIGIFVPTIQLGIEWHKALLCEPEFGELIQDPDMGVSVLFITDKDKIVYELIAPLGKNSPATASLKKGTNIVNHLAYETPDFEGQIIRMRELGCMPIGPAREAVAFGNRRVAFFYTPLRTIIELIEEFP